MTDEDDLTEGDQDTAPRASRKSGGGLDALALRQLRSARRLFNEGAPSAAEANFLVGLASVLATLDLASAIRDANWIDSDDDDLPVETPRKARRRRR